MTEGIRGMVRQYERLVYTICCQMVQDNAQAEDLAQETFLSAWIHREDCRPGRKKHGCAALRSTRRRTI